jgi:hypothetical protein
VELIGYGAAALVLVAFYMRGRGPSTPRRDVQQPGFIAYGLALGPRACVAPPHSAPTMNACNTGRVPSVDRQQSIVRGLVIAGQAVKSSKAIR